jgi:hypothetical protein
LRDFGLFAPIVSGLAVLAVFAALPVSATEIERFAGMKDCNTDRQVPEPGGYCVYAQSNLEEIRSAKAYYTNPVIEAGVLTSPITLVAVDGSTATGKCTYNFETVTGHCEFWSGTGELGGFHADIHIAGVTPTAETNIYTLTGTYWFDEDED